MTMNGKYLYAIEYNNLNKSYTRIWDIYPDNQKGNMYYFDLITKSRLSKCAVVHNPKGHAP